MKTYFLYKHCKIHKNLKKKDYYRRSKQIFKSSIKIYHTCKFCDLKKRMDKYYKNPEKEFEEYISNFYRNLLNSQEPLDEEFEKILNDNLWDLYETT